MAPWLGVALFAAPLAAHVQLDAPNGGETLTPGQTVTVTWHVVIQHDTQNWDLWYSTSGSSGPWTEIAVDLPLGNPAANTVHTFGWLVPAVASDTVRVRVRQDNNGQDYEDISDADLTIDSSDLVFADGWESGDNSHWSPAP